MNEPRGRVLCVDDEPDAALMLTTLLSLQGFVARAAHDGPAALALAEKFRPTACVVDIRMPGMDGYELARRLRELLGEQTVLLAVSGLSGDEHHQRAWDAGFEYVMAKPVDPDELLATLTAHDEEARDLEGENVEKPPGGRAAGGVEKKPDPA